MSCKEETQKAQQILEDFGGIELPDVISHLSFGLETEQQKNVLQKVWDKIQAKLNLRTDFFEIKSDFPRVNDSKIVGAHFVKKNPKYCNHNQNYIKKALIKNNKPYLFFLCLECGYQSLKPINGPKELYQKPINIIGLNGKEKAV